VLVRLHRARHTYDPARPLERWLFAIARHCAADHAHRQRQRAWEVLVDELPEAAAESEPDWHALADALQSLPRPPREAFSMLKLEGLSVGAAATRAGVTPGALKVRAPRAYKALKLRLGGT
jgi:RNA polymerase sigma-70 factor (ECF subfamily)